MAIAQHDINELIINKLTQRLRRFETPQEIVQFLDELTRAKIKTAIKQDLEKARQASQSGADNYIVEMNDYETEIDAL